MIASEPDDRGMVHQWYAGTVAAECGVGWKSGVRKYRHEMSSYRHGASMALRWTCAML